MKKYNFRRNLYTLKENTLLAFSFVYYGFFEQISLKVLEGLSVSFEPDLLFTIWWISHLVDKLVFFILKNCYVLFSALHEYPEFFGYQGKAEKIELRPIEIAIDRGKTIGIKL